MPARSDGLSDREERRRGTLPGKADSDSDGLLDPQELRLGTDPTQPDSDPDGISDGDAVHTGTNRWPTSARSARGSRPSCWRSRLDQRPATGDPFDSALRAERLTARTSPKSSVRSGC